MAEPDRERTLLTGDGACLTYRLWQPGRPRRLVVLVHGLASNLTRWSEFTATTRLREGCDLLRVDLRGFGRSLYRGRVGLDAWCADLAAILAAEGASRAVLVGHCLGADIVLHFAARQPAATEGLVLVEPTFRAALGGALRRATRLRPLAHLVVAALGGINRLGLHRGPLPVLDLVELDRDARALIAAQGVDAFPEWRYGSPLEDLRYTPTAVYLASLLALTAPLPDLTTVRVPTLALLSRGGRYGDPAVTARILAGLPRCQTRMLDARHWIPTERPAEMREAIESWVAEALGG